MTRHRVNVTIRGIMDVEEDSFRAAVLWPDVLPDDLQNCGERPSAIPTDVLALEDIPTATLIEAFLLERLASIEESLARQFEAPECGAVFTFTGLDVTDDPEA